jgi:hypothetical protein
MTDTVKGRLCQPDQVRDAPSSRHAHEYSMVDLAACHYTGGDHCGRIGVAAFREEDPGVQPGPRTRGARWPLNGDPATKSTSFPDFLGTNSIKRREWWRRRQRMLRTALSCSPPSGSTLRTGRHWKTRIADRLGLDVRSRPMNAIEVDFVSADCRGDRTARGIGRHRPHCPGGARFGFGAYVASSCGSARSSGSGARQLASSPTETRLLGEPRRPRGGAGRGS